jgi:chromosome segregation ATPase
VSSNEDLEQRLAAVEQEIIALREQVTDTHTLAAHADRDVAEFRTELRAQTQLLNLTRLDMAELRGTQVEQGERIGGLEGNMTSLREDVTALRAVMVAKFDQVHGGLEQIVTMLGALGGQADES